MSKKENYEEIKRRKIILSLMLFSLYLGNRHKYQKEYEILNNQEAYASYSEGLIYIGDDEYLESINAQAKDVLIEDQRDGDDPNFVIYNSCNINDRDDRNAILEVLCEYEKEYPSNWDRSLESMRLEWLVHNLGYYFNYKPDHTTDIDLDNDDEEKYDKKIINYLLKI